MGGMNPPAQGAANTVGAPAAGGGACAQARSTWSRAPAGPVIITKSGAVTVVGSLKSTRTRAPLAGATEAAVPGTIAVDPKARSLNRATLTADATVPRAFSEKFWAQTSS